MRPDGKVAVVVIREPISAGCSESGAAIVRTKYDIVVSLSGFLQ